MPVQVKLYGALRRYRPPEADGAPHHPFAISLQPEMSVHDLARQLGIPDGLVNAAAVNGEAVAADCRLQEGDEVNLFPPAAGG